MIQWDTRELDEAIRQLVADSTQRVGRAVEYYAGAAFTSRVTEPEVDGTVGTVTVGGDEWWRREYGDERRDSQPWAFAALHDAASGVFQ